MKFLKSVVSPNDYFSDNVNEVCFIGRSNVGKSSLINALANNKNIAKVSSSPGKTQCVNYYQSKQYRIVDLPGYGFAHVSKMQQKQIKEIIENYLTKSKNLFAIFHICDANVISQLDAKMAQYLQQNFENYYVVLNKIDKHNFQRYQKKITEICQFFNIYKEQLFFVSAKNKTNIKQLRNFIETVVNERIE